MSRSLPRKPRRSGVSSDGRGWFRTTDLSRVKRGRATARHGAHTALQATLIANGRAGSLRVDARKLRPIRSVIGHQCPFREMRVTAGGLYVEQGGPDHWLHAANGRVALLLGSRLKPLSRGTS
jgi:hypothetical protein